MLIVERTLVCPRWSCLFGFEEQLQIRENDESCPCAIADNADGVDTPLPRRWYHEFLSTALHSTTIVHVQLVLVFALEVTTASLAPLKRVTFCCLDVGHERGQVLDPHVVPVVCLVSGICFSNLAV